jgi:gamma-glutamyltranspeptidase
VWKAVSSPRLHNQLLPPFVYTEAAFSPAITAYLKKIGHDVRCCTHHRLLHSHHHHSRLAAFYYLFIFIYIINSLFHVLCLQMAFMEEVGVVAAVQLGDDGYLYAASDPRKLGRPAGF